MNQKQMFFIQSFEFQNLIFLTILTFLPDLQVKW